MQLQRWEIINHLIKKNGYKTYLEIGYYKGWSFDRVKCEQKTAVDPNPSKYEWMEKSDSLWLGEESDFPEGGIREIFKGTSNSFFGYYQGDRKWDIIFIDGLHESPQVDKDIQNALKHLNPGGTIVVHDCNPSSYEMTTTGTAAGEWTGDVYRSAIRVKMSFGSALFYVIDTDYGVGVLKPYDRSDLNHPVVNLPWEAFDPNREKLLNLISCEEFLEREKINQ